MHESKEISSPARKSKSARPLQTNTLQYAATGDATHCNRLHHIATEIYVYMRMVRLRLSPSRKIHCNTLQQVMQHTATHCSRDIHMCLKGEVEAEGNTLQHTATDEAVYCNR